VRPKGASEGLPAVGSTIVDRNVYWSGDNQVTSALWSDNDITLWPGESQTLMVTYRSADLRDAAPGWSACRGGTRARLRELDEQHELMQLIARRLDAAAHHTGSHR
jgi:hypothetical protein